MNQCKKEASPIARLLGNNGEQTVGWVYLWNTSELSILWIGGRDTAEFTVPRICSEILETAKSATPDEVIEFLEALSSSEREVPE